MLPQKNRLRKKKEIDNVFKNGKGFKEDFLILKIKKNRLKNSRFAFIVSRKVSKKANVRNKIRRRLRELVKFKIKRTEEGTDVILIAVPGLEEKDFWEVEETVNKLFNKAKICKHVAVYN